MHILCDNHFSISGCRYGDYCMFSHIPPPLPTIPYQVDKEKLAEETAKKKTKYYGVKHSKYHKLFEEFGKQREDAGIDHDWRDKLEEDDDESEDENLLQQVPSGMWKRKREYIKDISFFLNLNIKNEMCVITGL